MNTVPTPQPDEASWLDNPAIQRAVAALRAYGEHIAYAPMTRADAERLLPYWAYYGELSPREVAAVLVRFGPVRVDEGGWISGAMAPEQAPPRIETPEYIAAQWRAAGRSFRNSDVAFEFGEQVRRVQKWYEDQVLAQAERSDPEPLTRDVARWIRTERESREWAGGEEE